MSELDTYGYQILEGRKPRIKTSAFTKGKKEEIYAYKREGSILVISDPNSGRELYRVRHNPQAQNPIISDVDLLEVFEENKIDYNSYKIYKRESEVQEGFISNGPKIAVIIPVRGRVEFHEPVSRFLNMAKLASFANVSIIFVEHSYNPEHAGCCQDNYLWVPAKKDEEFNKCLCFNMGFLHEQADYYLFHDTDLLVQQDLFMNELKAKSYQAFKGSRVLYLNGESTKAIINGSDKLPRLGEGVIVGRAGAPGGSILVERNRFIKVGGYDPEYFTGYSVEDQFFHDKLSLFDKVESFEYSEMYHMDHGTHHARTKDLDFSILHKWQKMDKEEKVPLVDIKSDYLKSFIK